MPKDTAAPSRVRYLVLCSFCVAAILAYLCRQSFGVAESTIRRDLQLDKTQTSWIMASFFLVYGLGQLPGGWLARRFGSRSTISIAALLWSVATSLMGLFPFAPALLAGRLLTGVGQAALFPSTTSSIGKWFPDSRRAVANGAMSSCMSLGGAIGMSLTGQLITRVGWRAIFTIYGLVGMVFSGLFYLWYRNTPTEHPWANASEQQLIGHSIQQQKDESPELSQTTQHTVPWYAIYMVPMTWFICCQQSCRAAGEIFFSSWFPTFLQETRQVTIGQSGILSSLPVLGIVAGAFLGGSLSDWIVWRTRNLRLARSGLATFAMFSCAFHIGLAYFVDHAMLAVVIIALGAFWAALGSPCAYTVTIDVGGEHTPILFATMNMVGNLGAFAFIRIVPTLTDRAGWNAVLILFGLLYVGAALSWLSIDPRAHILKCRKI